MASEASRTRRGRRRSSICQTRGATDEGPACVNDRRDRSSPGDKNLHGIPWFSAQVNAASADLGQLLAPSFGTCHSEATLPLNTPGGYHAEWY